MLVSRTRPEHLNLHAIKPGGGGGGGMRHELQTMQTQPLSSIYVSKSSPLTALLKPASECNVLTREGSFAHSTGPKYLGECLP